MFSVQNLLLVIPGIIVCLIIPENSAYDGGLVFYDITTDVKILPPIITSSKYSEKFRLPFFGHPCTCATKECGCCVGMKVAILDFERKMCANVTFNPYMREIQLDMHLNDRNIVMYRMSALAAPPFCIPIPLPVPINLCLKIHDIEIVGNKLQACMKWIVKILNSEIFELHFRCFTIGSDGINFYPSLKPALEHDMRPDPQYDANVYDHVELDRRSMQAINYTNKTGS